MKFQSDPGDVLPEDDPPVAPPAPHIARQLQSFARIITALPPDGQIIFPVHYWDLTSLTAPTDEGEEELWTALRDWLPGLYDNAYMVEIDFRHQPPPLAFQQAGQRILRASPLAETIGPLLSLAHHPLETPGLTARIPFPGNPGRTYARLTFGGMSAIKLALEWLAHEGRRPIIVIRRMDHLTPDICSALTDLADRHIEGWDIPHTTIVLVMGRHPFATLPDNLREVTFVWEHPDRLPSATGTNPPPPGYATAGN
jgi:hypothetical protein